MTDHPHPPCSSSGRRISRRGAARLPRLSRRALLGGSLAGTALAATGGASALAAPSSASLPAHPAHPSVPSPLSGRVPTPAGGAGPVTAGAGRFAATQGIRTSATPPPLDPAALRAAVHDLSHPPSVSAQLRVGGSGEDWYGTAGVADLTGRRSARPDDAFRAGSITKVFVATVVLQLWAERRVDLDAAVQRYLPGLLPDSFAPITVTHLLDHTSGLPDHQGISEGDTPEDVVRHRFDQWTPRAWVETVTHRPLKFAPGTKQEYRGINYVLLALLVEKLTGRPYGEVIGTRLLRPLGLRRTVLPGDDIRLHGPHVHNYLRMSDGSLKDITVFNVSSCWGEGELVSTVDDLDRFLQALFAGRLLPPRAMARLFTMPPDGVRMLDGSPARYSAGLQQATVNGITFWGKTGEFHSCRTRMMSTRDLSRRFVLTYTPTPLKAAEDMTVRVVGALTGGSGSGG